jgi:L-iditol 2-dehydrogenase
VRVAMYYNNHDVRLEELPTPRIGPGELLIKVVASGICGSDVMEWYRVKKAPRVLGHEVAGDVAEVGAGLEGFQVGQRVTVTHHVPCNTCHYCLRGQHTLCDTLRTTSFDPGGFAEYLRVPRINVAHGGVFALPDEVSYTVGTFVEPVGCALRGMRVARFQPGQSVLVLGSGLAGVLSIMLARALGAGRIIATDVNAHRLQAACRFGADVVLDAREGNVPERVRQANADRGTDQVFVCTAASVAFEQALEAVDRGGTVLLYAINEPGSELPFKIYDFWLKGVTLVSTYGASPLDLGLALELLRAGRLLVEETITHRLPLAKTGHGFRLVAAAQDSLKVIVEPGK